MECEKEELERGGIVKRDKRQEREGRLTWRKAEERRKEKRGEKESLGRKKAILEPLKVPLRNSVSKGSMQDILYVEP